MLSGGRATLDHFEAVFAASPDPWGTRSHRDEACKRRGILRLLGPRGTGRMLELGCGNGSNSRALARRTLHLHACDGAAAALRHAARNLRGSGNVSLHRLVLPGRFPNDRFDAVVIAELLYYLDDRTLASVAREVRRTLRPGGRLVLCHHHTQFADAVQRQSGLHRRFMAQLGPGWPVVGRRRTARWKAAAFIRPLRAQVPEGANGARRSRRDIG